MIEKVETHMYLTTNTDKIKAKLQKSLVLTLESLETNILWRLKILPLNPLRPEQNGAIFKYILINEDSWISNKV